MTKIKMKPRGKKPDRTLPEVRCKCIEDLQPFLVAIDDLELDPANARLHPDRNLAAIVASLERFGFQKPLVVSADGIVVAGNGSVQAARQLGWTHVPVVKTKLKGQDRQAYAIADNKIAELAEWDYEKLSGQLRELVDGVGNGDLTSLAFTGWSDFEIEPLLQASWSPSLPTVPVEEHVRSKPGTPLIELDESDAERIKKLVPDVRTKLKMPENSPDSAVILGAMLKVAGK
jgi:hypothetical protein